MDMSRLVQMNEQRQGDGGQNQSAEASQPQSQIHGQDGCQRMQTNAVAQQLWFQNRTHHSDDAIKNEDTRPQGSLAR